MNYRKGAYFLMIQNQIYMIIFQSKINVIFFSEAQPNHLIIRFTYQKNQNKTKKREKIKQLLFIITQYFNQTLRMINTNPLNITNSELAQVQKFKVIMEDIFSDKFSHLEHRKYFYTNIFAVTRFSIAREFKKEKVIQMWVKWVEWYESYKPDEISQKEEIVRKIHTSGKYRFCGVDKTGCPVLVIRMKYHVKGLATAKQNLRYLLYMMERGVKLAEQAKTYQISVIFDRREMGESDEVSKESMKEFMPFLNDYYPETLKSFYVLGANMFYRAMWAIARIFISKRTEQKINLLEDPDKLVEFIDKSNLDESYGGNLRIEDVGKIQQ